MMSSTDIHCVIPEWNIFEEFDIPVCAKLNSTYERVLNHQMSEINRNFIYNKTNPDGCPLPCTLTKYNPTVLNLYSKAMTFENNKNKDLLYILLIYYTSTKTEIKRQYFVYDFLTIISAIGGALGLLLGYSFLSIMLSVIHSFEINR